FTISHLRFGDNPIQSTYQLIEADYIACHHPAYVDKYDVLKGIKKGGIFVLNCPYTEAMLEDKLPSEMKRKIALNEVKFYIIDAHGLAKKVGLGQRINMVMQTAFFKLAKVLPIDQAITLLKNAIEKTYARKGADVVDMNKKVVDMAANELKEIKYPSSWKDIPLVKKEIDTSRPEFIRDIADVMEAQEGDRLPVSKFKPGGIFPMGTAAYEKRGLASEASTWIESNCIQCNQCSFVCPHAAIRPFLLTDEEVKKAPEGLKVIKPFGAKMEGLNYCIAITPLDCTGCKNCVIVCPATKGKALAMKPIEEVKEKDAKIWDYLMTIPTRSGAMNKFTLKGSQFEKPLLEFSGACAGCGETPYVKLATQLFGDRMIIANATGCSSIWGGSAPSMVYTTNDKGYGPAWANSLFEDNAEFGFGIYLGQRYRRERVQSLIQKALKENVSNELKELFTNWIENFDNGEMSADLYEKINPILEKEKDKTQNLKNIYIAKDLIVKPAIWIVGGDGWAYDIGYGGLDHVLALGEDVNILVVDTELYSNTGMQSSKATPMGSLAKFAASGKRTQKKDLGLMAMVYGNVYVASISMGSDKNGALKAMREAESFKGPSLVIAYAPCIGHGLKGGLAGSQNEEDEAVKSGYWFTYRFDPRLKEQNKNPFILDCKEPVMDIDSFISKQMRYEYLKKKHPDIADALFKNLKEGLKEKLKLYQSMAQKKES
ncbi:MAG: hypothetical protein K1000chlam1_01535, partial [Candidatus Anoxychlamydiales bacterium]|nr:hypothetical protein [Candidatus Anoxychlamydiales bacterium]